MRAPVLALALLLTVVALSPPPAAAGDFAEIGKVNKLVSILETPQLAPGESGPFRFVFNSTYTEPIENVRLNASIYQYATIEQSIPVDDNWPYAFPRIAGTGGREWIWSQSFLPANTAIPLNFTVETVASSRDMPHGSIFSQASYFVRFWIEFDGNVSGTMQRFRFASRGFFSTEVWQAAEVPRTDPCDPPWCRGFVNLTILGVDGIVPDSAFSVKEPIPTWPFYLLIALSVFFLVLAFLFWVEENPESYPRIGAWWARTKGRFIRTRRTLVRPKEKT